MPHTFRQQVRSKRFTGPTAGHCGEFAQANLAILPSAYAEDFLRFCLRNPKAVPAAGRRRTGRFDRARRWAATSTSAPTCPATTSIATASCASSRPTSVERVARRSGACSPSAARSPSSRCSRAKAFRCGTSRRASTCRCTARTLRNQAGRRVRRPDGRVDAADDGRRTRFAPCRSRAGSRGARRAGPLRRSGGDRHRDLEPGFRRSGSIRPDELPVFWACGVTPQSAIESARLPFAIAHRPGHMLVTDIPNTSLAVL